MNYIKREGALQVDLDGVVSAGESDFDVSDLDNLSPIGMLYQTGYLTIADYSQGLYQLRVPDEEVKRDMAALLAGVKSVAVGRVACQDFGGAGAVVDELSGRTAKTVLAQ